MKAYSKYRAVKTKLNGIVFDSKKEAKRYCELRLLEKADEISDLEIHVVYHLDVHGYHICNYEADFVYRKKDEDKRTVEDVKGFRTPEYRLKKELMKAIHGIDIVET